MNKKIVFYISIILISAVSTFAISALIYEFALLYAGSEKAVGILTKSTAYLFFLRLTGTLAFICIGIATVLGALRNWILSFHKNIAFWQIHTRWASSLGIGFATSHFVIFLLYEVRLGVPLKLALFAPSISKFTSNSNLMFLALVALSTFSTNMIISHIPGVQGKKWWKPLHILNYFGFFLVLIHAFYIGGSSSQLIYEILYAVFLLYALSGSFHRFTKFAKKMRNVSPPQIIPENTNTPAGNTIPKTDVPPTGVLAQEQKPPVTY